jgi:hypothetical protein
MTETPKDPKDDIYPLPSVTKNSPMLSLPKPKKAPMTPELRKQISEDAKARAQKEKDLRKGKFNPRDILKNQINLMGAQSERLGNSVPKLSAQEHMCLIRYTEQIAAAYEILTGRKYTKAEREEIQTDPEEDLDKIEQPSFTPGQPIEPL